MEWIGWTELVQTAGYELTATVELPHALHYNAVILTIIWIL